MISHFQRKVGKLAALCMVALVLAISCPVVQAQTNGTGTSGTTTSSTASWWSSFLEALQNWFANAGSGSGGTTDPTATDPAATDATATDAAAADTTTASAAAASSTPVTFGSINPDALAQAIANDSGGHADQYAKYSERLAETLSRLTPAQRARIFTP